MDSSVKPAARRRRPTPWDVLSGIADPGSLEHAIQLCMAAIQDETGAGAVSLRDLASRVIALRRGRFGDEPDEPGWSGGGAEQAFPLRLTGVERGSVVLFCDEGRPRRRRSKKLGAWLGLLTVLLEAAQAGESDRQGCVSEAVFLRRLEEQCLWSKNHDKPLSVVALAFRPGDTNNAPDPRVGNQSFQLAARLKERLRYQDTITASGDVLRCLLPNTDKVGADIALARIEKEAASLAATSERTPLPARGWVSSSVTFPDDGDAVDQLWNLMDQRLSRARHAAAAGSKKG